MNLPPSVNTVRSATTTGAVQGVNSGNQVTGKSTNDFRHLLSQSLDRHAGIEQTIKTNIDQNGNDVLSAGAHLRNTLLSVFRESEEISTIFTDLQKGKRLNHSELLEIQGRLMNFTLDLSALSKLIEHTVGAVKTVIQTQV